MSIPYYTVADLIEDLKKLPQDLGIRVFEPDTETYDLMDPVDMGSIHDGTFQRHDDCGRIITDRGRFLAL